MTSTPAYTVRVFLNVGEHNYDGYQPEHPVADTNHDLRIEGTNVHSAAEAAFAVGNRQGADLDGHTWPSHIRSVSVGDLVRVTAPDGSRSFVTVGPLGWDDLPEPANPRVPLSGQSRHIKPPPPPVKKSTAVCPVCRRYRPVRKDGRFQVHTRSAWLGGRYTRLHCQGSETVAENPKKR